MQLNCSVYISLRWSSPSACAIDPEINRIKKAKFSMAGVIGHLDKYDIEVE